MAIRAAEFFAGMGLVRAGLEPFGIKTVFANDVDERKAALYRENWSESELRVADIRNLRGSDIPTVDLAKSSFPCVGLSIAGDRLGLAGERSGLVFEFCRILAEMGDRAPQTVMIENVPGFLTANHGQDFDGVKSQLAKLGYSVNHLSVDAAAFVPQSRLRVFVLGHKDGPLPIPIPPAPRKDLRLFDIANRHGD